MTLAKNVDTPRGNAAPRSAPTTAPRKAVSQGPGTHAGVSNIVAIAPAIPQKIAPRIAPATAPKIRSPRVIGSSSSLMATAPSIVAAGLRRRRDILRWLGEIRSREDVARVLV